MDLFQSLTIAPAPPGDWFKALDLVLQHLPAEERGQRRANVLTMLASGEIGPHSILVARQAGRLAGAMVYVPLKGATCLFWPPQATPDTSAAVVDSLVRHALASLQADGTKIAQVILPAAELPIAAPLLRGGFQHVTQLQFLRHRGPSAPPRRLAVELSFESYQPGNQLLFHKTLERTYEGTLDIPELNGRRSIEEVIAGHQGQGKFRPEFWCLAVREGRPVGVVMLADSSDGHAWEMSYLGVVPEARGLGIGWALAHRGLDQAFQAGASQLLVAVDARNRPARQLYEKMGFVLVDEREVLLFFFVKLAAAP